MGTEPQCILLLYRAILTLAAMPDPDMHWFRVVSAWPSYPREFFDAYNSDEETEPPWLPTPRDVTTYLTVLAWARDLDKRQRQIMALRARSYSLELIADMLRIPIADVEYHHAEAVQIIVTNAAWQPSMAS